MSIPEFDITGQKVLIVGGGRDIGKGIALAFAEAGSAAYDAAKAGVMRFTESLAQEWAPFGARINAVAPGLLP